MTRPILALMVVVLSAGLWLGASSSRLRSWWSDLRPPKIPTAEPAFTNIATPPLNQIASPDINRPHDATVRIPVTEVPREKNLAVPFTSQAPDANWDAEHEEFCEEAAVLMVGRFFQGRGIANTADAESALQQIKQWELDTFGFFKDTTAAQTAQMVEGLYGGTSVRLLTNPTVAELKSAIAAGQPVIVPAAGRLLKNPNFKRPGPLYHMLVLKGYTTDGRFITNDPGTRRGADYLYDPKVIMNAMHDWNGGDVDRGAKIALVVSR